MDTNLFFHFDSSLPPSAAQQFTYPSSVQSPEFFLTSIFDKSVEYPYNTSFESPLISTVSSPSSATTSAAGKLNIVELSPHPSHLFLTEPYLGINANIDMSMFNPSLNFLQPPIMNHLSNLINTPSPPMNPLPSLSLQGELRVPIDLKMRKTQARTKRKKPMENRVPFINNINACKLEDENGEPNAKRSRLIKVENDANESCEPPPPPKDYIHVRARRGQATDSHSLAERVRREKISERMKLLEDLVPGCSKVTGKALMLDEIINYVQSLQRQVEFLSMKLATVNHTRLDFNLDSSFFKKDPSGVYPLGTSHAFDCTEIDGQLNCGSVDPMASCLNIVDEFGQLGSRVIDNLSYEL